MTDASLLAGGTLTLSASGDLLTVSDTIEGQQRVLRRLLTNPGDYLWHIDYGAGLGALVGQPANDGRITALARGQMFQEAAVARTPAPVITTQVQTDNAVILSIRYADALTGQSVALTVPVG